MHRIPLPNAPHKANKSKEDLKFMKHKKNLDHIFPNYGSRSEVLRYLQSYDSLWECFNRMPKASRELLIGFFLGQNGLPVTYDSVFQRVFDPEKHPERLEALLSALFGRKVKIIEILPREGTQLTEQVSFVIMDVLVTLDDDTRANLEMQKIGYEFPVERNDCYGADITAPCGSTPALWKATPDSTKTSFCALTSSSKTYIM